MVTAALASLCIVGILFYRKRKETIRLKSEVLEQAKLWQETQDKQQKAEEMMQKLQDTDIYQRIIERLKEEDSPMLSKLEWEELEATVCSIYPHFVERLRGLCQLNSHELHVCLLRKILISPSQISQLTHKSKQAINSTRERLYQKAFGQKGTPSEWDDFLQSIVS